ncbi:MAG: hypothetical protein ACJ8IK_18730 [Burkholderiaceae bacterium]
MHRADSSSLAHILASPWQQRRNAGGGLRGAVIVVALCFAAPVGLAVWSLFCDPASLDRVRQGIVASSLVGAGALVVAGWAVLVGNVLQQNHPTMARLVPGHVARLRAALLAAWAVVVLAAAAGPGYAFDAPLVWACETALALAVLTAALRWPVLWAIGLVGPFLAPRLLATHDADRFYDALHSTWLREDWLVTAVVLTAGALVMVAVLRSGGSGHRAGYVTARALARGFGLCNTDSAAAAADLPMPPRLRAIARRPYAWWTDRLLARRDSPVMARLLVGLGPATHWTTRIRDGVLFVLVGGGVCAIVAMLAGREFGALVAPWLSFSLLTGACTPALQAVARLHQTRREQALLVLLPGVPRGARLNRWLAWRMSLVFVVAALFGFALAAVLNAFAEAIQPGVVDRSTGGMALALFPALLPQVAWQWRQWARLRGVTGLEMSMPGIAPVLLGLVALVLHLVAGFGYLAVGVAFGAAALLYCAWRWHRMAGEPTALPVGRLA